MSHPAPAADLLSDPPKPDEGGTPAVPPAGSPAKPAAPAAAAPKPGEPATTDKNALLEMLPDDLKGNASLSRFTSVEALARSTINLEKLLGGDKVPIPKDDTDTEGFDRIYKALGRPDEPTGYQFPKPEKLPEGITYDEPMELWWRQSAHKAGLSERQAKQLYTDYRDRVLAGSELSNKQIEQEIARGQVDLRRDWGGEHTIKRGMAAAQFSEMPEDVRARLQWAGLLRLPSFIKYLADTRAKIGGEREPKGGEPPQGVTPDQIKGKIATFRTEHNTALYDSTHVEHTQRVKELQALYDQLYPPEPAAGI